MAQFDVHRNNGRSRIQYPFLVIVQSGLLRRWDRRVVIPMAVGVTIDPDPQLTPAFEVDGMQAYLLAREVGNVPIAALGELVGNLDREADRIVNALDMVFSRGFPVHS